VESQAWEAVLLQAGTLTFGTGAVRCKDSRSIRAGKCALLLSPGPNKSHPW